MGIFMMILTFIGVLAFTLLIYWGCRKYIFKKVRVNKWVPLSIAIVLFLVQMFFTTIKQVIPLQMLLSVLSVIFFLWFMDILQTGGPKKQEKKIVIKPKAKPNRVKHRNNGK
ncbi:hypothetical protein [Clostridium taeniosporum]|uniref:Uncharacterized protein n=1 Tax=Clostridium taeniosporum TaxID=394958 RepID=A0A1D7XLJ4_9CLOT|nr:hypothetical protein [Clostridium taeniosporum]AOR24060.1 hypothetical protein BGI42_10085 [Clostridium taeniosporum]